MHKALGMYRVSQKSIFPLDFCTYFRLWSSSADKNLPNCLRLLSSPMYQFWSHHLNICEYCNTLCDINSWILTVHFNLLQYLQMFFFWNQIIILIKWHNKYSSITVIRKWSYLTFKMPSISWYTGLQSFGEVLHTFSNRLRQHGSLDLLQCVHQLGSCFGHSRVFVAIANSKDVGWLNDVTMM